MSKHELTDEERRKQDPMPTEALKNEDFKERYKKKLEEDEGEKVKMLLASPKDLIEELDKVIPPWFNRTTAINDLIRQHVEYIKYISNQK